MRAVAYTNASPTSDDRRLIDIAPERPEPKGFDLLDFRRARQGEILDEVSRWVDEGRPRSTLRQVVGPIDAAHPREAHRLLETGRVSGKLVIEGFSGRPPILYDKNVFQSC